MRVRDELIPVKEFSYPVKLHYPLPIVSAPLRVEEDFLRTRRTVRGFGKLEVSELSSLLWQSANACHVVNGSYGRVTLRPSPSSGARHPIDILLIDPAKSAAFIYCPATHGLNEIHADCQLINEIYLAAQKLLNPGCGLLLWLVAQPARTAAKYENSEGFVLLDAGALVATLSFAAHALKLAYCPLGISGEPLISRLLNSQGQVAGILGGVVGSRVK
jgi:SagB-type dehydrogenase family enzyme